MEMKIDWESLSQDQKAEKFRQIGELLIEHGLSHINPIEIDKITLRFKDGQPIRSSILVVCGSVYKEKQPQVKAFKAAVKSAFSDLKPDSVLIDIDVKLKTGTDYLPIKDVVNIITQEKVSLDHKPGQVFLIDFWDNECVPGQSPMDHHIQEDVLEHHGARWGDNVKIIRISVDEDVETVLKHVQGKNFTSVQHYTIAASDCSQVYQVDGLPFVILVDTHGKLAFIGYPDQMNLCEAVEKLLKGEKLPTKDLESDVDEREFKEVDVTRTLQQMSEWEKKIGELANNDVIKAHCQQLTREFVQLIRRTKYDVQSGKLLTLLTNQIVLVGEGEHVDPIKEEIETFVKNFDCSMVPEWMIKRE